MAYLKMNKILVSLTALVILFTLLSCNKSKHYQFSIADDISGEQLAARVSVTDRYGQTVHIDGIHTDVEYLGKKWCYTDGLFSVTSEGKDIGLEVRRGPETLPVKISHRLRALPQTPSSFTGGLTCSKRDT